VVDRLERIYEGGQPSNAADRLLTIKLPDRPKDFVGCIFDRRTRMLCEASSGYFYNAPRAHLPAGAIAALGRLGFSTDDSAGNFQIWFDIPNPPDFNRIADIILEALHDGYTARADMKLDFNAPLAPNGTSRCVPVS
jgi:hypothetical protein